MKAFLRKTRIVGLIIMCSLLVLSVTAVEKARAEKFKVAFALLWTIDDMGWTTAHYRGIQRLQEARGDVGVEPADETRRGPAEVRQGLDEIVLLTGRSVGR